MSRQPKVTRRFGLSAMQPRPPRKAKERVCAAPSAASSAPVFGDPAWIAQRGPVKVPKLRLKGRQSKVWKRYKPIWQRIEGEWKRLYCTTCRSQSFKVIQQRGLFVYLLCAEGDSQKCLAGFSTEKPDE